jgi:hypothetical protein
MKGRFSTIVKSSILNFALDPAELDDGEDNDNQHQDDGLRG